MAIINGREVPFVLVKGDKGDTGANGVSVVLTDDITLIDDLYNEFGKCNVPLIWSGDYTDYTYFLNAPTGAVETTISLVPYELYSVSVNIYNDIQALIFTDFGNIKGADGAVLTPVASLTQLIAWKKTVSTHGACLICGDITYQGVDYVSGDVMFVDKSVAGEETITHYSIIGDNGTTYTPSVSSAGVLSWTNDGGKENPESVDIVTAVINALPSAVGVSF